MTSFAARYVAPVLIGAATTVIGLVGSANDAFAHGSTSVHRCPNSDHVHTGKGPETGNTHTHRAANGDRIRHTHHRVTNGGNGRRVADRRVYVTHDVVNRYGGCPEIANNQPWSVGPANNH